MRRLVSLLALLIAAIAPSYAQATTYYVSDCQVGAASGCVAGNDSNAGTSPNTPWKTAAKVRSVFADLNAGDSIVFAKGGSWTEASMSRLANLKSRVATPITFDSYQPSWYTGSAKPILTETRDGYDLFEFSGYSGGQWIPNEGYVVRNLDLRGGPGTGTGGNAFFIHEGSTGLIIDNVTTGGFGIGLYCGDEARLVTIRNSDITYSRFSGVFGGCSDLVVENNRFDNNGYDPDPEIVQKGLENRNHAIYISSGPTDVSSNHIIRGNTFTNTTKFSGVCKGAVIVVHGMKKNMLFENNLIDETPNVGPNKGGCWGIAVIAGPYGTEEHYDDITIRGNRIVNVGNLGIALGSCRNCTVENNVIVRTDNSDMVAIQAPGYKTSEPAALMGSTTIRNNTIYFANTAQYSTGIQLFEGTGHTLVNNLIYFGAGHPFHACFNIETPLELSRFTKFDNNLCHHAAGDGFYSQGVNSLSQAQAAGFDIHGSSANPLISSVPSVGNNYLVALGAGSPAINAGDVANATTKDITGAARNATPDIGAFEYAGSAASVPGAPVSVVAVAGNAQATVMFASPASDGGSAVTGYTVVSNPAGGVDSNAGSTNLSHVIAGLVNGTSYTFTVKASNAFGSSIPSTPSNSVTPAAQVIVPGAPTNVVATAGNAQAIVSFASPSNTGGGTISGYTVVSNPPGGVDSNAGSNSLSHVITGLVNGTSYTFTVSANNSAGAGPASVPSNSVTPSTGVVATVYYVSDCQAGAVAGCVAGNDANSGTSPAAPWKSTAKVRAVFGTLNAGDSILFAKGGSWINASMEGLRNLNTRVNTPIVIDAYQPSWYAGPAKPILMETDREKTLFEFSGSSIVANEGYVVRNLDLRGGEGIGTGGAGFFINNGAGGLIIDAVTISGFSIGYYCGDGSPNNVLRNSIIAHNRFSGVFGGCSNWLIENNVFDNNGFDPAQQTPNRNHAIYFAADEPTPINGLTIRGNTFTNNVKFDGVCQGTVIVGHGVLNYILIERNLIDESANVGPNKGGCWGIVVSPGHSETESVDKLVIRGNRIVNVGGIGIETGSCRNCTIENNVVVKNDGDGMVGIQTPGLMRRAEDVPMGAVTIRNNSIYIANTSQFSTGIQMSEGSGHVLVNNLIYFAADVPENYCFDGDASFPLLPLSSYARFDNNLCHHAGGNGKYSFSFANLAQAQAAGFDLHGSSANPQFAALPTAVNGYSLALAAGSPVINRGDAANAAPKDVTGAVRDSQPDIGAYEFGGSQVVVPPGAPTNVKATAVTGMAQATVTFSAPGNTGGGLITGYTVISNPRGAIDTNAGSTSLSHKMSGLTKGTTYTFTVIASNAAGTGPASSPSNSIKATLDKPSCTLTVSPSQISAGGSSVLTATCSPAATSYTWKKSVLPSNVSSGSVSPKDSTTYYVIGHNAAGEGNKATVTVRVR